MGGEEGVRVGADEFTGGETGLNETVEDVSEEVEGDG